MVDNTKEFIYRAYENTSGYISKMYINNHKYGTFTYHYNSNSLAELPMEDEENLYISQNTFYRPIRNSDNLKRLNMLYVDLDCYKVGLKKEYVFELLCDEYFGSKIPRPTFIIDSGRGLYLLWKINEDRNAFPRWKKVQHYLHNVLKELGSDSSVTEDVARVLRVPGSINSKTGTKVEIIREYKYTYSLYEIIRDYIPENNPSETKKTNLKKYGNIIKITSLNTLFYARIKDIEKLLLMRDKNGNVRYRENSLFLYRYCCCHYYNDTEKALQMTLNLYSRLSNQSEYTDKDIKRLTKSGEKYYLNKSKKFTNRKIIELLDIDYEEQKLLSTLISKENANQRKAERNKLAYRKRLKAQGKDTKENDIKCRRNKIRGFLKENKSIETICKILKIAKSTYYRDLEVIRKEDSLISVCKNMISKKKIKENKIDSKILDSQKFSLCITEDVVLLPFPSQERPEFYHLPHSPS